MLPSEAFAAPDFTQPVASTRSQGERMAAKAVIVVDVQGDFTTWKNGALAVPGTDRGFIETVRRATEALKRQGIPVFATQDWHPADHVSFHTSHPGGKPFDVIRA
jgi:nicotinamidase/pyrazinamidase